MTRIYWQDPLQHHNDSLAFARILAVSKHSSRYTSAGVLAFSRCRRVQDTRFCFHGNEGRKMTLHSPLTSRIASSGRDCTRCGP